MATKTDNTALFATVLAEVASEAPARPRNAQRTADRREATPAAPKPTAAKRARATAKKEAEATLQAAREGRTQGTQTGTPRTGRNGKVPCSCQVAVDAATNKPLVAKCGQDTWRTFAPGHDARLKGALIRHGLAGGKVRLGSDETEYSVTDAAGAWGFREQVANGLDNPDSKIAKRARAAARREAAQTEGGPKAKAAPKPRKVSAKVGRWTYEGELVTWGDGQTAFRYTKKGGKVAETTKFRTV